MKQLLFLSHGGNVAKRADVKVGVRLISLKAYSSEAEEIEPMWNRTWLLACISLALVAAFFLLREHWAHALGFAPYLLLLACPLLHLFHGHGGHAHGSGSGPPQSGKTP